VSQPSPVCPDCKVPTDSGFIVDFTYGTDASEQPAWVKGRAEPSLWTGAEVGRQGAVADRDISLPDVRPAAIVRACDLARVASPSARRHGDRWPGQFLDRLLEEALDSSEVGLNLRRAGLVVYRAGVGSGDMRVRPAADARADQRDDNDQEHRRTNEARHGQCGRHGNGKPRDQRDGACFPVVLLSGPSRGRHGRKRSMTRTVHHERVALPAGDAIRRPVSPVPEVRCIQCHHVSLQRATRSWTSIDTVSPA
jgi:hypothetical protein